MEIIFLIHLLLKCWKDVSIMIVFSETVIESKRQAWWRERKLPRRFIEFLAEEENYWKDEQYRAKGGAGGKGRVRSTEYRRSASSASSS